MMPISTASGFGLALLLGAASLVPAPVSAMTPADLEKLRAVCKDQALQQRILAHAQGERRRMVEWELENHCPQLDLPSAPVHDKADPSPAASHSDWVFDARFSADGRTIVSAGRDGTVRVWDAQTGKPIRRIVVAEDDPSGNQSKKGIVRSVTFVGDGTHVAAASDRNPVRLIELATGKIAASFPVASDGFGGTIAATTGGLLFIGGHTDTIDAIDVNTRAIRYRLPGHNKEASAIAISETADLVATAASSMYAEPRTTPKILLWRLSTGEKIADFVPAGGLRPAALAFSRDGAQLAVANGEQVHIYAVADKRVTRTIEQARSQFDLAFTADGKGLIMCSSHPVLWDLATGRKVRHFGPFSDLCHSIDVSSDGRFAVTTSLDSDLRVWEIGTGTFHRRLGGNVTTRR